MVSPKLKRQYIYIYMHIYICILYINTQVIPTKEVALKMMKKSFQKCIELSAIQIPVHYSTIPLYIDNYFISSKFIAVSSLSLNFFFEVPEYLETIQVKTLFEKRHFESFAVTMYRNL